MTSKQIQLMLREELALGFRAAADALGEAGSPPKHGSGEIGVPSSAADDLGKGWDTYDLPELVGNKEACELLSIDKMTLKRWMEAGSGDFPPRSTYMIEPQRIDAGPVWTRRDVERHAEEIGRQRARQKRKPDSQG